jgi:hypothetical protein
MTLNQRVRDEIEARLAAIERGLRGIEGLVVERDGDRVAVRGTRLVRRSIEDVRLRFARFLR